MDAVRLSLQNLASYLDALALIPGWEAVAPLLLPAPPSVGLPPPSLALGGLRGPALLASLQHTQLIAEDAFLDVLSHNALPPAMASPLRTPEYFASVVGTSAAASPFGGDRPGGAPDDRLVGWAEWEVPERLSRLTGELQRLGAALQQALRGADVRRRRGAGPLQAADAVLQQAGGGAAAGEAKPRWTSCIDLFVDVATRGVAPFACRAPWCTPESYRLASTAVLPALEAVLKGAATSASDETDTPHQSDALLSCLPSSLLAWSRRAMSVGGAWKGTDAAAAPARWVAAWCLAYVSRAAASAPLGASTLVWDSESVGTALPVALRLCDDWEATNNWLGASCLYAVVTTTPAAMLGPFAGLIQEAVERCLSSKHPLIVHIAGRALVALTALTAPPPPAYRKPPPAAAWKQEGPYNDVITITMRASSLATDGWRGAPLWAALAALLQLAVNTPSTTTSGSAKQQQTEQEEEEAHVLTPYMSDIIARAVATAYTAADASVVAAALHACRALVLGHPRAFGVDGWCGADAGAFGARLEVEALVNRSSAEAEELQVAALHRQLEPAELRRQAALATAARVDKLVGALAVAEAQAEAGLYSVASMTALPPASPDAPPEEAGQGQASEAAGRKARQLVADHCAALRQALHAASPHYASGVEARLRQVAEL